MDRYLQKENYITRNPNPSDWVNHPNVSILKIYSEKIHGRVLDFGCNHGACTFYICDNKNVNEVLGLDLNENAIEVAKITKKSFPNHKIDFISSNILDIEFSYKFDTIVSFHTLEHIYHDDIDKVVSKLYNFLNINGFVIVSIPWDKSYFDEIHHVMFFDNLSLSSIFEKHNFKTIECFQDNRHSEGGLLTGIFQKVNKIHNI